MESIALRVGRSRGCLTFAPSRRPLRKRFRTVWQRRFGHNQNRVGGVITVLQYGAPAMVLLVSKAHIKLELSTLKTATYVRKQESI